MFAPVHAPGRCSLIQTNVRSKDDLLKALAELRAHGLEFWREILPERFARSFGEAWSPADNVRHLIKSTVPVTLGMRLPKFALRALFGQARADSQAFPALVDRYHAALAAGAKAGRFAPSPRRPPGELRTWQAGLISRCQSALAALERAVTRWSEHDLDRCRLPHPLLGKITVREMVFFTLLHFDHHRDGVARRLKESAGQPD